MVSGPADPEVGAGMLVRGGAGGTRAHLTDLLAAAAALDDAALSLADAEHALDRVAGLVEEAAVASPATAAAARDASAGVLGGPAGLRLLRARVADLAAAVRSAEVAYRDTETLVERALAALTGVGLTAARAAGDVPLLGLAGVGLASIAAAHGWLAGRFLPRTTVRIDGPFVEATLPFVAATIEGAAPGPAWARGPVGDPVPQSAGVLAGVSLGLGRLLGSPYRPLVVTRVPSIAPRTPVPRSAGDLLRQVAALAPTAGTRPGTVSVQRLDRADGSRAWVVAVPGTQEWSPLPGRNPVDALTNLRLGAQAPDDMSELVVRALAGAGAGRDEPVVLAGHSQGGIVAMRVAADPAVAARFDVAAVVTAGAPVATVRSTVPSLHLEHVQDVVPALEGAPNADEPRRTTVTVDLDARDDPTARADAGSLSTAHGIDAYVRTAEALEGAEHPSLRSFDAALGTVLGGTVAATTTHWSGTRGQP